MQRLLKPLALVICSASCQVLAASPEPADPKANPRTRAVLAYFQKLSAEKEKRILSGQFVDYGPRGSLQLLKRIHEVTGQWPALAGFDYADHARGGLHWEACNQAAIEYWNQGGLVTIGAHFYNPANPKGGGLRDKGVEIASLLADGTDTHARWMKELDELATGLDGLQKAGVVVLWRPFHEMNGNWFWWCAQEPAAFIRVWRHMFDYFTTTRNLHNLLWVYGPNHGRRTADYFPGDRYADLVGLDAYTDHIDPDHIKGYPEMVRLGKPFGFTEFGPHGAQNPPGDYDYRRLLEGIRKNFPETVFFMSWNHKWSLATNQFTRELLSDPRIINRDQLPSGLVK